MLRTTKAATALVLAGAVTAGCGGDAGDLFDLGGDGAEPADETGEVADGLAEPPDGPATDPDTPEVPDWDGPNDLDLEFDEFRAVVREAFDDNDTGRGSSNMWPAPTVDVEVRAGSMSEAELVASCEELTGWLFERPQEEAIGPVIVQVSERESGADLADGRLVVVNQNLIPREQRGSCETL